MEENNKAKFFFSNIMGEYRKMEEDWANIKKEASENWLLNLTREALFFTRISWGISFNKNEKTAKKLISEFKKSIAQLQQLPKCAEGDHRLTWNATRTDIVCPSCGINTQLGHLNNEKDNKSLIEDQINFLCNEIDKIVKEFKKSYPEILSFQLTEELIDSFGELGMQNHPYWELFAKIRPLIDTLVECNSNCKNSIHEKLELKILNQDVSIFCSNCQSQLKIISQQEFIQDHMVERTFEGLEVIINCLRELIKNKSTPSPQMKEIFKKFIDELSEEDSQAVKNYFLKELQATFTTKNRSPLFKFTSLNDLFSKKDSTVYDQKVEALNQDFQLWTHREAYLSSLWYYEYLQQVNKKENYAKSEEIDKLRKRIERKMDKILDEKSYISKKMMNLEISWLCS